MKVARLCTFLDFGGVEKRFDNISCGKHPAIENTFLAIGHGGRTEQRIKERGVPVICFNLPHKIPSLGTIMTLARYFKREAFDVVHTSGAEANFHGILAAKLAGIKVKVAEEIGYPQHGKVARIIFKWIYGQCRALIVNAEGVKQHLKEIGEIREEGQAHVIHNPCLIPEKHRIYTSKVSNSIKLITVSRLTAVKNLDTLLKVLAELNKVESPGFQVTMVGEGEDRESLEQQAVSLGIREQVNFTGFKEPQPYLMSSDIYVLPSHTEGFSNALLEAMALGMCCVATQVGGATDIIEHGVNGWLIDPKDPENIASTLREVANLIGERKRVIGIKARQTVESRYSLEAHMDQLYKLYSGQ